MSPESAKLLWDAQTAIQAVLTFCRSKSFNDYAADLLLRSATERQLEILGEALGQLRKRDPDTADRIPDLSKAVALRNILIHAYGDVNPAVLWGVVEKDLPVMAAQLMTLLPRPSN